MVWSGMVWVGLGAVIAIPTICCSYAHIAHRRGDQFAQRWFVTPLILVVLIAVVGVIAYRTYVVGFD